jgi:hypothetical protein
LQRKKKRQKIEISQDGKIMYISVDPEFKILHGVNSIKILSETEDFNLENLLKLQLQKGKTVFERIRAARILINNYSPDVVKVLKNKVIDDEFYGVSVEAANILGKYNDKNNYNKTRTAYEALEACLKKELF